MTEKQTRDFIRPNQMMVHLIQVHEDRNLKKELKALAELQDIDEKLAAIKNRITKYQPTDQTQSVLQNNVLCVLNGRET